MAIVHAFAALRSHIISPPLLPSSPTFSKIHIDTLATARITTTTTTTRTLVISPSFAMKNETSKLVDDVYKEEEEEEMEEPRETLLYAFTPLPLLFMAALPGGN